MPERTDGLANPDGLVSRALWQTQHAVEQAFDDALVPLGMTTTLAGTLGFLVQEPGQSAADLARRARVAPQSVAKAVARLEQLGLLRREPHPVHGRVMRLYPTDAGRDALTAASTIIGRVEKDLCAGFDARARSRLLDDLDGLRQRAEGLRATRKAPRASSREPDAASGTNPGRALRP